MLLKSACASECESVLYSASCCRYSSARANIMLGLVFTRFNHTFCPSMYKIFTTHVGLCTVIHEDERTAFICFCNISSLIFWSQCLTMMLAFPLDRTNKCVATTLMLTGDIHSLSWSASFMGSTLFVYFIFFSLLCPSILVSWRFYTQSTIQAN